MTPPSPSPPPVPPSQPKDPHVRPCPGHSLWSPRRPRSLERHAHAELSRCPALSLDYTPTHPAGHLRVPSLGSAALQAPSTQQGCLHQCPGWAGQLATRRCRGLPTRHTQTLLHACGPGKLKGPNGYAGSARGFLGWNVYGQHAGRGQWTAPGWPRRPMTISPCGLFLRGARG